MTQLELGNGQVMDLEVSDFARSLFTPGGDCPTYGNITQPGSPELAAPDVTVQEIIHTLGASAIVS